MLACRDVGLNGFPIQVDIDGGPFDCVHEADAQPEPLLHPKAATSLSEGAAPKQVCENVLKLLGVLQRAKLKT